MKFISAGFGNMVADERILAIVSPDSAPIKRLMQEAKDQGKREEQGAGKVLFVRGIGGDSSWDARRQGFPAGKHDPGCRAAVHLPGKEMRIPVSPRKGPAIWPMRAGFNPSGNASGGHSGQPCPCASRRLKCRQHAGKEEP